jgi:hypothetical protein
MVCQRCNGTRVLVTAVLAAPPAPPGSLVPRRRTCHWCQGQLVEQYREGRQPGPADDEEHHAEELTQQ